MKNKWLVLALFVVGTMGIGALIGISTAPGPWYAQLEKPPFNPPNWIFGPVWSLLYAMLGVAGWRLWCRAPRGATMRLWFLQMLVNFSWSPVFFGMHLLGTALLIIAVMITLTAALIIRTWPRDRIAALLMLPYLAWISFASLLNASLWWLN